MILLDSGAHPGLLQKILLDDYWLFTRINREWTHPIADLAFIFIRESELWIPLYLFLLVFITLNFRKKGWLWALYGVMTVIISDLVSSHLIKQYLVFRLRPCNNPLLEDSMRFLADYCPSNSSFTSSPACNYFAIAFFIFRTLRFTSRWWWALFPWAFLISYAQVYVGLHFPLDVICGAIVGAGIGSLTSRLFRLQFDTLLSQPTHTPFHA